MLLKAASLRNTCSSNDANEIEVQSTETSIIKALRCDAPFGLVSTDFYKYAATLLLSLKLLNQM